MPTDEDAQALLDAAPEEVEEWNTAVFESAISMNSTYQHQGQFMPSRIPGMEDCVLITHDQKNWKAKDVLDRRQRNEPVHPVFSFQPDELGKIRHVLTDADADAVEMGYLCGQCLQWQKTPLNEGSQCRWAICTHGDTDSCEHTCYAVRENNGVTDNDLRRFHQ